MRATPEVGDATSLQTMAAVRRRVKKERRNPIDYYTENEFRQRYRLPKASVEDLAADYFRSGFCSTACTSQGGGITAVERVSRGLPKKWRRAIQSLIPCGTQCVYNIFKVYM